MKELDEMEKILEHYHKISGFRISIFDSDYKEIYSFPHQNSAYCTEIQQYQDNKTKCIESDRSAFLKSNDTKYPYIYKCPFGLIEAVAPIYNYGVLTGYLMMGQFCEDAEGEKKNLCKICEKYTDRKTARELVNDVVKVPTEKIHSYLAVLTIIAGYITNSNRMNLKSQKLAPLVREYINTYYYKKLSLNHLCDKFGRSKSTIINAFGKEYGISPALYITKVRLDKGAELLSNTEKPIKEISAEIGLSDQNYFTKLFIQHYNSTPSAYRKRMSKI